MNAGMSDTMSTSSVVSLGLARVDAAVVEHHVHARPVPRRLDLVEHEVADRLPRPVPTKRRSRTSPLLYGTIASFVQPVERRRHHHERHEQREPRITCGGGSVCVPIACFTSPSTTTIRTKHVVMKV